jgi:hypothetical protein
MEIPKANQADNFKAPWGTLLIVISGLATFALVGIPLLSIIFDIAGNASEPKIIFAIPLLILVGAIPFLIRGYIISGNSLIVQRIFWNNVLELSDLVSIDVNPEAMSKSIRTFGNGGLFSFSGKYRNKALGPYRAFATKIENSVVLKFPDKTVVVTPDNPQLFVERIKSIQSA